MISSGIRHAQRDAGAAHFKCRSIDELVGPLRQHEVRQAMRKACENGARATVRDHQTAVRQHIGLGHEMQDVHVRRQRVKQVHVTIVAHRDDGTHLL